MRHASVTLRRQKLRILFNKIQIVHKAAVSIVIALSPASGAEFRVLMP